MTTENSNFIRDLPETKNRNVFVMMRYQTGDHYEAIESTIRQTICLHGLISHLAKDRAVSDDLWSNLTYYMNNSSIGIAVFEKIDFKAYNANVMIEAGYMLGQSKPCLLLKEKRLKLPTDFGGKLYRTFDSYKIQQSVKSAVSAWLQELGHPLFGGNIFYVLLTDSFGLTNKEIVDIAQNAETVEQFLNSLEVYPTIDSNMEVGRAFRTLIKSEKMRKIAEQAYAMLSQAKC